MGIEVRRVDYVSEVSLVGKQVISTLLAVDGTWAESQVRLLQACLAARVQRFAPAKFSLSPDGAKHIALFASQLQVMNACRKAKEHHSEFEYAGFHLGIFMNFLGYGAKNGEEEAINGMNDTWRFIWDVENMKAEIPLTKEGTVPSLSMMELTDVGHFVAAVCLLPKGQWQEDFSMVGETIKVDEVVDIVEKVRGRKMETAHRKYKQVVEEAKQEEVFYPNKMWADIKAVTARNEAGLGIMQPVVNQLCPQVKPMGVLEYVDKFWG
ncbi:hypothetical protein BDV96DRAFT_593367 [Lophiotrema nucula]|uniref:NmrA-like domain-containing protein n=1 Tax=Lophiotrema nucula TaxID=690887 RepID=A0A6A5ZUX5_9PLEO|nr:hypothetical protein BDV96DRAFT_593367 [Lophiotrema nucula]